MASKQSRQEIQEDIDALQQCIVINQINLSKCENPGDREDYVEKIADCSEDIAKLKKQLESSCQKH